MKSTKNNNKKHDVLLNLSDLRCRGIFGPLSFSRDFNPSGSRPSDRCPGTVGEVGCKVLPRHLGHHESSPPKMALEDKWILNLNKIGWQKETWNKSGLTWSPAFWIKYIQEKKQPHSVEVTHSAASFAHHWTLHCRASAQSEWCWASDTGNCFRRTWCYQKTPQFQWFH